MKINIPVGQRMTSTVKKNKAGSEDREFYISCLGRSLRR